MSYLEEQKRRVEQSKTAPYQRILLALGSSERSKVCAFEGVTDLPFYDPLLRSYAKAREVIKPRSVHCGSREIVLRTRERLADRADRVMYVIDKDHTNYVPGLAVNQPEVFVTKYYSVESYSVGLNKLTDFLSYLFRLEPDSDLIAACADTYRAAYASFTSDMRRLHAIVICLKRNGRLLHLSNIPAHKVFTVTHNSFQWAGGSPEQTIEFVMDALEVERTELDHHEEEIAKTFEELSHIEPLDWMHGKYVLSHLTRFLASWYRNHRKLLDQYGRAPSFNGDLNDGAVLSAVAHFHGSVDEFTVFLDAQFGFAQ